MLMGQQGMVMFVTMRLVAELTRWMGVLMMVVVHVQMLVLEWLVDVHV